MKKITLLLFAVFAVLGTVLLSCEKEVEYASSELATIPFDCKSNVLPNNYDFVGEFHNNGLDYIYPIINGNSLLFETFSYKM